MRNWLETSLALMTLGVVEVGGCGGNGVGRQLAAGNAHRIQVAHVFLVGLQVVLVCQAAALGNLEVVLVGVFLRAQVVLNRLVDVVGHNLEGLRAVEPSKAHGNGGHHPATYGAGKVVLPEPVGVLGGQPPSLALRSCSRSHTFLASGMWPGSLAWTQRYALLCQPRLA